MDNSPLDAASLRILRELQTNCRLSLAELAAKLNMSNTPCWRRQKELEDQGYIARYAAIVNREKVGLSLCCHAQISLNRHAGDVVREFEEAILMRPEVVECYETTGTSDYLIKVVVADTKAYHDFIHNVLFRLPGVGQVNTTVALREVKYETKLPL